MPDEPLICERCKQVVLATVNVADRTGPQWWCFQCHIEVRDAEKE